MNPIRLILSGFLCFMFLSLFSQNAPVTILSDLYDPPAGATVVVPVTVSGFEDISGISLILEYDPAVLTFQSALPNAAFSAFELNGTNTPGRIVISWYASYGITLANGAHLVDITFVNNGGTTALSWYSADESSCEYARYNNGAYTVLNDSPFADYYINGSVYSHTAPLTWVPVITNATAGVVNIPVMVNRFNDIGAVSLTLEFDPAILVYQNIYVSNSTIASSGSWWVGIQDAPNGRKYIRLSWTKNVQAPPLPAVSLPDNSILISLQFNYAGGKSDLVWFDNGSSCEYADGNFYILDDNPIEDYYQDGLITEQQYSPHTELPCLTGIAGQEVIFPVKVNAFSNIGTISLTLDYDPAVLTYQGISTPGIPVTWSVDAGGPTGKFVFGANGNPGLNLPDGSILFNIIFIYNGGNCLLTWNDDDPISCEYSDATTFIPMFDLPREDFYTDGCIGPALKVNGKTFLQGSYNTVTKTMTTNLQGLLPLSQPYFSAPWNYLGSETATTIPANVTDWVLVQLRTLPTASSAVATRAGLLLKTGAITDLDAISSLSFTGIGPGYYYVVIYHRNHIAVMSSAPVQINAYSGFYDFSADPSGNFGGVSGLKLIDPSVNRWGMISADATNDQNIYINDYTDHWVPTFGTINGYSRADFNMDGNVYIDDYTDHWVPNFGKTNPLP